MTPIALRTSWTFGLSSPPIPDLTICCSQALQSRDPVKVVPGWITGALDAIMVALSFLLRKSAAKERLMESPCKGKL
jgi:hypothetical protein